MTHYPSDPYRYGAANRDAEDEALGWVVRLTSGEATDAEQDAFRDWQAEPENAAAYRRARRLWQSLGPVVARGEAGGWPIMPDRKDEDSAPSSRPMRRTRWHKPAAIAASVLLFAASANRYVEVWQHDYVNEATAVVSQRLSDGSRMTLGPDTALDSHFDQRNREVSIARGEAFFDVRHDAARPFLVSAGNGVVRVTGTAFSVRRLDDGTTAVTVARGRVMVTSQGRSVALTPNQQISFGSTGLGTLRAVDAPLATAWTDGRIVMENRSLDEVLAEVSRYRSGRIFLLNKDAGRRRVNAVIDVGQIDNWLEALSASQKLSRITIGSVTILR